MKEIFPSIHKEPIETLQVNLGHECKQACKHCHVNSSPFRTEKMSNEIKVCNNYVFDSLHFHHF